MMLASIHQGTRHVGVGAIACIYFDGEVGLSSVGSAIYCAGVHALLRSGEVGLPAMSGVGPYVTLSVETGTDRYTQVQSMEENWIGLLLNRVMRMLVCVLDVMFTFLACFPIFFLLFVALRITPALLTRLFACHSCGAPYSMV